jgi:hypothetical protein
MSFNAMMFDSVLDLDIRDFDDLSGPRAVSGD